MDTVSYPFFINQNGVNGYYESGVNIVVLPTGSWIGARELDYTIAGSTQGGRFTSIVKVRLDDQSKLDTLALFGPVDASDIYHTGTPGFENLAYNKSDNRVYYACATHSYDFAQCTGSYNYLQVASTDTNLRGGWRKFILSAPSHCLTVGGITTCAGRSGVLVSGIQILTGNSLDTTQLISYIYRIDSTTTTGVNDPTAPITIRNRVATYPNPATDNLTIDDILGHLATATFTNMQGQLVFQKNISGTKAIIPLKDYPPGLYLLRVKTTDGELYSEKILKQ